ncbi:helix-turn-helix domain-containing protein [Proteiniphilum sp. UBA5384]|uniref:helix-turn-helix domain-containing protein n=1 Tax=Proteiniphilum sp. UBA5384 TaxID=1947279 RepID=UPI0025CE2274|nr:helix-turn-helix transcriptional regulator [Proteiniphilum sp. UBA5384]
MKDRIRLIMEKENLTPAKFADRLQINRAIISHILNGRNNPSLEVVTRILSEMDYINPEWLLNGTGSMYKNGSGNAPSPFSEPDLFHQVVTDTDKAQETKDNPKETTFKSLYNENHSTENKVIDPAIPSNRKITQIIVYYNDNTFEIFGSH